jgi:hypothetical protein
MATDTLDGHREAEDRKTLARRTAVLLSLLALVAASGGVAAAGPSVPGGATQAHIAVQNTWFTAADVRRYGVGNGVISISGHWFLQDKTSGADLSEFLTRSQEDVERRLGIFKAAHPEVDPNTDAVVVMDIERPHPKHLHTYSRSEQNAIVAAYMVRIAATRAVFPNAKLALYGTLSPDELGRPHDLTYIQRRDALIAAGRRGLYDDLDFLVPVPYVRFGCDDVKGRCDRHWDTLDEYMRLGVAGSSRLRRSDGSSLPLLPLLSFRVYDRASAFHRELLMKLDVPDPFGATLGKQIDILAGAGVGQFALWTGKDSDQLGGPADPRVTDYLYELCRRYCRPSGSRS